MKGTDKGCGSWDRVIQMKGTIKGCCYSGDGVTRCGQRDKGYWQRCGCCKDELPMKVTDIGCGHMKVKYFIFFIISTNTYQNVVKYLSRSNLVEGQIILSSNTSNCS